MSRQLDDAEQSGELRIGWLSPVPTPAAGSLARQLHAYAQAFLRGSREQLRFILGWNGQNLAVTMKRRSRPTGLADEVDVSYAPTELPGGITSRELDVLTLLSLGLTNGQISSRLGTTVRTVSTQVERLLSKLEQPGRSGLTALAVDAALLRLPIPGGIDGLTSIGIVELQQLAETGDGAKARTLRPVAVRFPAKRPLILGTFAAGAAGSFSDAHELSQGSALAVHETNSRGGIDGRRIEHVVVEADILDEHAVRAAFEVLFDHEVDAINTSYVSEENPHLLDLVGDYGTLFLHTETFERQTERVQSDLRRYGNIFQTCPSETHYGSGFIRFLEDLERRGLWSVRRRTLVTIEVESTSTHTTNETFLAAAERGRWDVADIIRCPLTKSDWADVVDRLAALDPDAVMVTHFVPEKVAELQKELHQRQLPALVYYVYAASVPAFQAIAGDASEGVIWSTVTGLYDDVLGADFRRRYSRLFGVEPGWSQASSAYDQVNLLASAWQGVGTSKAADVAAYLRQAAVRGLNGVYYLGSPGQAALSYPDNVRDPSLGQAQVIYQIQDGRPRVLGPEPMGDVSLFRLPPRLDGQLRRSVVS